MIADTPHLPIIAVVFTVAGFIKGVIGLGLPTISMGLMSALMPANEAATILLLPSLATNIWQMLAGPALVRLARRLWPMMAAIAAGTLATAGLIAGAGKWSTILIGAALVSYAAVGLAGRRFPVSARAETWAGPSMGLTTGLINGATGIFVIPGVPYLQSLELPRDELVQAMAMGAITATAALSVGLGINGAFGAAGTHLAVQVAVALAGAFAGMALGQRLRQLLSAELFRRVVLTGLAVLGAAMIARSVA